MKKFVPVTILAILILIYAYSKLFFHFQESYDIMILGAIVMAAIFTIGRLFQKK